MRDGNCGAGALRQRCTNGRFGRACEGCKLAKVGSSGGWEMRDDADDKKSNRPGHAQNVSVEVVDGGNGGCAGVFFCLRLVIAWRGAGLGMRDATGGAEEERKAENQKCKRQRAKR